MSFLDQIEPVRQAALAELRAAPDLAALEQARVNYLGANGKFTGLMKQLGSLAKEEKPAAGKAINTGKVGAGSRHWRNAARSLNSKLPFPRNPLILPCPAAAAPWANSTRSPR